MKARELFIVDDDLIHCEMLKDYIGRKLAVNISIYKSGEDCLNNLDQLPDIIILDFDFGKDNKNSNGLEILKKIKAIMPRVYVLIMTAENHVRLAVQMMSHGACDYIVKDASSFEYMGNAIMSILNELSLNESVLPLGIKHQIQDLKLKYDAIDQHVSTELKNILGLIDSQLYSVAIEKIFKVIENYLRQRLKYEKSIKVRNANDMKNLALKYQWISQTQSNLIDNMRIYRNNETHELNVKWTVNEIVIYMLAGIEMLNCFWDQSRKFR